MRTKALLCAAALAAGALTSMAQVYSANVVGYVNVTLVGNGVFNLVCNPLDATMGGTVAGANNMTNLLSAVHPGDQVYRWNVFNQDFDFATIATKLPSGWDIPANLPPGEGFFIVNNGTANYPLTFVGQVNQGTWAYPGALGEGGAGQPALGTVVGSGGFNALGAPFPIGGPFTNSLPGNLVKTGDQLYPWSTTANDFDFANITTKLPGAWDNTTLQLAPGIGFFYINNGANVSWSASFTVQ